MSERKELPFWVNGIVRKINDNDYVDTDGCLTHSMRKGFVAKPEYDDNNNAPHYCDLDGEYLTFNIIKADENGFYAEEVGRVFFNQYEEIEGDAGVDVYVLDFMFDYFSTEAMRAFARRAIRRQPYYNEIKELLMEDTRVARPVELFKMFLEKKHKFIPLLLQEGLTDCIYNIFTDKSNDYEKMTKNSIALTKKYGIELSVSIKLCEMYNPSELFKFCELLKYFHFDINETMGFIAEDFFVEIQDFTAFANYFLKCIILYGDIEVNNYNHSFNNVRRFLEKYRDYLLMIEGEEGCDLYPDNLQAAHDAAADRNSICENGHVYNVLKFKAATDKYSGLAWEKDEYTFVVPKSPQELIDESKVMHHCVWSYIESVTNENTKIVLVRKDNVPYITLEIKGNKIIQAKKRTNILPNFSDSKLLEEYAKERKLKIKNY